MPRLTPASHATVRRGRLASHRSHGMSASLPERVRVGFVGAGRLATRAHYPSLAEMDDVDLVAIAELDPDRLTATADRFGISARHSDYRVMLEREEIDAVYLIMPPHQLFDVAVACLRAGKHLMVEKPPGVTTYQTQALAWHAEAQIP